MDAAERQDDWDPRDPEVLADAIPAFDRMRRSCPVAHSDYLGWSAFRHADVVAIAEDHATYSSKVSVAHPALPNGFDPPEHDQYRALVDRYFRPDEVAGFCAPFTALARDLTQAILHGGDPDRGTDREVDRAADHEPDHEVEFIGRFALPFALRAQRAWLNWPGYMEEALGQWMSRNQRATLGGDRAELDRVALDFDDAVRRVIAERRAHPAADDDITARLLRERVGDRPLRDDEIVSILRNWTVGELGTVAASIGIVVGYLATHDALQSQLRAAPSELPAAIDEILRMDGPLLSNRRVTTTAVELGGRGIGAGERVTILWASANRDEEVFGDPDEYRPHENAANNVLYGRGIHDCPGAPLARLELQVVVAELLAATSSIRPAPGSEAVRAAYPATGYQALPLLLTGGPGA